VARAGLGEDDTSWFKACRDIFESLNNFYNGSIFKSRPELEAVSVSNKVVRSIIRDLQPENSPYNFAVLPVEILGTIYERFLGRVVRTTDKQVKIEDKPEVRKAGGVYYTPQYIVDYIVKNTLGKLLAECKTPAEAAKLKILDPACGSGSFLLGAYSALIEWYKDYYARAGKEKRDRASFYIDENGEIRLTAKLKREILRNNLFGVDIDPQAVEVTVFSLSLKALEDLREGELTEERTLFHQTVLPDLSANIKNGNSLIGSDYFSGQMFPDMEEMKQVRPFDWEKEFPEIMGDGGFDAVIGNPPYVRMELFKEIKDYLRSNYVAHDERTDLYVYFIERSVRLLSKRGLYGVIVANRWIRSKYGERLRKYLLNTVAFERIIDFGELPVFEQAATMPVIIILRRKLDNFNLLFSFTPPFSKDVFKQITSGSFLLSQAEREYSLQIEQSRLSENSWKLESSSSEALQQNLETKGIPLFEYVGGKILYGIKTGLVEAFVINKETRDKLVKKNPKADHVIKPYVVGDNVRKYHIRENNLYLIYTYHGIDMADCENVIEYLNQFKSKLEKRATKQKWYELQQPQRKYSEFYEMPKIIYPDIAKESRFAFDESGIYPADTTFIIPKKDFYLLGLLNSKLIFFYLGMVCPVLGDVKRGGRLRLKFNYVKQVPIRAINFNDPAEKAAHDNMVALVEQILAMHKDKAAAKTQSAQEVAARQIRAVDEAIDKLVYALYELSEEEIRIVEGKT